MKSRFLFVLLALMSMSGLSAMAQTTDDNVIYVAECAMPSSGYQTPTYTLNGTGTSITVKVSAADLKKDVTITATSGFAVSQNSLKAGDETELTITNTTYRKKNIGKVIMRSGDYRAYINLVSYGSQLETKSTLSNKVTLTDAERQTFPGFNPEPGKGYTVEFRAKVDDSSKNVEPFAVSAAGIGFKGYVTSTGTGLYNGYGDFTSQESFSNPSNGGTFYNTDGEYHTYRYAVTPDERVIVYRDGITVDSMRVADLGHQPEWCTKNGAEKANLLKNGDFEGEYDYRSANSIVARIEGWDVYPWDQWNSQQGIVTSERSNDIDQNNHAVYIDRYMWDAGWAAGEISQIVDVAPNETYSLSALAKGGIKSDGTQFGSIRIYDLQNSSNKVTIPVTSDSWQTYATDFETLANTEQIRVSFYIERASWGASVSSLTVDDVRLTGVSREVEQQIGFKNNGADIEYFSFDTSGAYAPAMASISTSLDSLSFAKTGEQKTVTVNFDNLTTDISVSATSGFSVTPNIIKAGDGSATLTITNDTYRRKNVGKVILRAGDKRKYIKLSSRGTELETKSTLSNKVTLTDAERQTFPDFNPEPGKGYTVEFRAKVDDSSKNVEPFAVSAAGIGFKGYVTSTGTGLYNGYGDFTSQESFSNPSNGGTFYNTDGEYHTYRYAVTPDERVIVYRDGITVDSMRVADLGHQPEWCTKNGAEKANLLKNGDFEGEYDYRSANSIVARIEGWDVYPWDQWNSQQGIVTSERSNDIDQNNHAVYIDRYMWDAGWAAGEISQIVDVAPNETYSLSALAKGGIKSDGTQFGSIRIYDLQNSDNKVTIPVTSDSWQTYATDFETLANTEQIRVSFYIERASWGASVSSLTVDDVRLTGVSREVEQQIGFKNNGADIEYFSFDTSGAYAPAMASISTSLDSLSFAKTGEQKTVTVNFDNLTTDISVSATSGFSVTPNIIKAGDGSATLTITNDTYRRKNVGKVILRAGDKRKYIQLSSRGSELETKSSLANKVTLTDAERQTFPDFNPEPGKGYTVEFRAKVDDSSKNVEPFAVSAAGIGFKGYVTSTGTGLYNGYGDFTSQESFSNPSNGGTFYNTDGEYHTYRYAVTPDERVIVYRDGITVDSMRVADLGHQPEWCTKNGAEKANLLKNGDFEGEYDYRSANSIVARIEGWDVYPWDQWNSQQGIVTSERSNDIDQNNHAVYIDRYMWDAGWAAGEISQIVDVAPNETYSLSALAKGGIKSDGTQFGSIRIYDLQNSDNKVTIPVTSDSWQTYATDFETLANTEQIRVSFYIERASWGASVSSLTVDDVRLTGVSREVEQQIGFKNNGADIEYFSFDTSGAYAPAMASIEPSVESLIIAGSGNSKTVNVSLANLVSDVTVSASTGFAVYPTLIKAGTRNATITVTNTTWRRKNSGKLTLRSGDKYANVLLTSYSTDLEPKAELDNVVALGDGEKQTFEGFAPSDKGYTLEVQVKVDDSSKKFEPYAVSSEGVGFKGFVTSTGTGLYNGYGDYTSTESMSNPSNGGTFYNTDGEYHTYRYAVTPDERVIVYRDGITVDSMRVADLASQPEWLGAKGKVKKNLLKNPGFEGEYDHKQSVVARIEGWDVYPWDQYNTTQDISSSERGYVKGQNNHAVSIDRYMWEGGWAAGEISQIVDVAPNEIYSLSALAKGGIKSDGTQFGSIRIYDLQNSDNKVTIPVKSDSWTKYATDFETLDNTEQIRVSFCIERASWGASVSSLMADDVVLRGVSREVKQMIGFNNDGADVKYFAFDNTGAYAPAFPVLQDVEIMTAVETPEAEHSLGIKTTINNRMVTLHGVETASRVAVYTAGGAGIALMNNYTDGTGIALPNRGTYIILVEKNGNKKVVKVTI